MTCLGGGVRRNLPLASSQTPEIFPVVNYDRSRFSGYAERTWKGKKMIKISRAWLYWSLQKWRDFNDANYVVANGLNFFFFFFMMDGWKQYSFLWPSINWVFYKQLLVPLISRTLWFRFKEIMVNGHCLNNINWRPAKRNLIGCLVR